MAIDEALLCTTHKSILRVYQWEKCAVSFGYPQKLADAKARFPNDTSRPPMDWRWHGGARQRFHIFTDHPARCPPFAGVRPVESYRLIHKAVQETLPDWLPKASLAGEEETLRMPACFNGASLHDLMLGSVKLCGGAQRAHQGGSASPGEHPRHDTATRFRRTACPCNRCPRGDAFPHAIL